MYKTPPIPAVVAVAVVAVAAAAVTQMALEAQELDLMVKPPSVLEWRELLKASSCTIWRNRCYFVDATS